MDFPTLPKKISYRVNELVQASGLSRTYLYDQMKSGALPYLKAGRCRLVLATAFQAFLEAHQHPSNTSQA